MVKPGPEASAMYGKTCGACYGASVLGKSSRRGWRFFKPVLAGASLGDRLLACVGAALGIAFAGLVGAWALPHATILPLVAPIGASAVLLFAVPASPLAQPWPVIGGNTVSALIGVGVARLGLPIPAAAGVAVGLAILAMSLARCLHPPGGAAALNAVIGGPVVTAAGWAFPFAPVAMNSVALVVVGLAYHRFSGHTYPHRPEPVSTPAVSSAGMLDVDYLDQALEDLGETLDVSREDLVALFQQMQVRAAERLK